MDIPGQSVSLHGGRYSQYRKNGQGCRCSVQKGCVLKVAECILILGVRCMFNSKDRVSLCSTERSGRAVQRASGRKGAEAASGGQKE